MTEIGTFNPNRRAEVVRSFADVMKQMCVGATILEIASAIDPELVNRLSDKEFDDYFNMLMNEYSGVESATYFKDLKKLLEPVSLEIEQAFIHQNMISFTDAQQELTSEKFTIVDQGASFDSGRPTMIFYMNSDESHAHVESLIPSNPVSMTRQQKALERGYNPAMMIILRKKDGVTA